MNNSRVLRKGHGLVQRDVMTMDISIFSKGVYCLLASYTGDKNSCYPSLNTIVENLRISKSSVLKAISELEKNDLLLVKRRTKNSKQNMVNEYIPLMLFDEVEHEKGSACGRPPSACDRPGVVREADRKNNSIKNNIEESNINSKTRVKETRSPSFEDKCNFFIELFNETKGTKEKPSRFKLNKKVRSSLKEALDNGYASKDIKKAIENCKKDEYHINTNLKYLTPEFILRPDKLERFLNVEEEKKVHHGELSNSMKRRMGLLPKV